MNEMDPKNQTEPAAAVDLAGVLTRFGDVLTALSDRLNVLEQQQASIIERIKADQKFTVEAVENIHQQLAHCKAAIELHQTAFEAIGGQAQPVKRVLH